MRKLIIGFILFAMALPATAVAGETKKRRSSRPWRPVARFDKSVIHELSGMTASRKYPHVFWAHGDSGRDAKIVAFNTSGKVLAEVFISGAPNADWEDVCTDDAGHIYIGDIGNNVGAFPARYIYVIDEPDPYNPPAESVAFTQRYRYVLAKGDRFDAESLVWWKGSLYLLTKERGRKSRLFRLDETGPEEVKLTLMGTLSVWFPTAADTSPDGKKLLVCGYTRAQVFQVPDNGSLAEVVNRGTIHYPGHDAIEACTFDGDDVLLAGEDETLFKATKQDLEAGTTFTSP